MSNNKFSDKKEEFDKLYHEQTDFEAIVPVHLELNKTCKIKKENNSKNEEYYKWQFIYSIVNSGMYTKDYIGTEVYFPKGNKNSAPIKFDIAIFKDEKWFSHYKNFHEKNDQNELDWLRKNLIVIAEIKHENSKNVEVVYNQQLKPGIKEIELQYALGILYDTNRLYIFRKNNEKVLRFDETLNKKGENSTTKDLSLDIPDAYSTLPNFKQILKKIEYKKIDRENRTLDDLDIITGSSSTQLRDSVASVLKVMDTQSLDNERGYQILIQILALKIFDEERSDKGLSQQVNTKLKFYANERESHNISLLFFIKENEKNYMKLSDKDIQCFITRMRKLYADASGKYRYILRENDEEIISWKKESHIKLIGEIVKQFQDFSFIRSKQTDLYQLVFYQFANAFSKAEKGQFITPLPVIDFMVDIVNPKRDETIIDPTAGIADFLAKAYKYTGSSKNDENLYGLDNDEQMVTLAQLNMLLNGAGNANLKCALDKGSILYKFNTSRDIVELDTNLHKDGNWDNWLDSTTLKKFDIVLTNPPFGDGRRYELRSKFDQDVIELYELWDIAKDSNSIDLGLVFLENAYHVLDENGRMGIILSNSLASVDKWNAARKWLMEKMRIVALFDLPSNTFADTGVNTTIIVAYKPSEARLKELVEMNYSVFVKDIKKIGYEVKTLKRVKYFEKQYKLDDKYLKMVDREGNSILEEDFTETVREFKDWCNSQEKEVKELFL